MKYNYSIGKTYFPPDYLKYSKSVGMLSLHSKILYTISTLNYQYLNYYIQEITKLISSNDLEYQELPLPIKKYNLDNSTLDKDKDISKYNLYSKPEEVYVKPMANYLTIYISDEEEFEQTWKA